MKDNFGGSGPAHPVTTVQKFSGADPLKNHLARWFFYTTYQTIMNNPAGFQEDPFLGSQRTCKKRKLFLIKEDIIHEVTMNLAFLIILAGAVCSTGGTIAIQKSNGFRNVLPTLIALVFYGCSTVLLSLSMTHLPVALAHSLWSGVVALLLLAIDRLFFKIQLPAKKVIGVFTIIIGIALLSLN